MGVADDLLTLADHLAAPSPTDPEQVWFRRSVSTAYYALFHLLAEEAAQRWNGSAAARVAVERACDHRTMKEASEAFSSGQWSDWSNQQVTVPPDLRFVARAFVFLQAARHSADYDNAAVWTRVTAGSLVQQTRDAFQSWHAVRTTSVAEDYLLALVIGKRRR